MNIQNCNLRVVIIAGTSGQLEKKPITNNNTTSVRDIIKLSVPHARENNRNPEQLRYWLLFIIDIIFCIIFLLPHACDHPFIRRVHTGCSQHKSSLRVKPCARSDKPACCYSDSAANGCYCIVSRVWYGFFLSPHKDSGLTASILATPPSLSQTR